MLIWLCRWIYTTNRELEAFKLKVAEQYVSSEHLKDVEERLVKGIERIQDGMEAIRQALIKRDGQ